MVKSLHELRNKDNAVNYKPRNTLAPENMVKILDFVHKP